MHFCLKGQSSSDHQVKVIKIIPVFHNRSLNLARVDPGDEILHTSCYQTAKVSIVNNGVVEESFDSQCRISDYLCAHSHMALFNPITKSQLYPAPSTAQVKSSYRVTPVFTSGTIPFLVINTPNLRRQNADTLTSCSTADNPAPCSRLCLRMPMAHSFSRISDSVFLRNGSSGSSADSLCARLRRLPHMTLYFW